MRFLLVLMWLLHWLPLPILGRLGEAVGSLLFIIMTPRRRITLINLRLCMPELPETDRRCLAKQHFQAYARSILERGVLWWGSEQRLRRLIQVEPGVPLDAFAAGPLILLCPHFVCLDVAGVAIALEASACSIYAQQQNRVFDEALRRGRERFHPVQIFTRAAGINPVIRAMRNGLPFFMFSTCANKLSMEALNGSSFLQVWTMAIASSIRAVSDVAAEYGVSWPTAHQVLIVAAARWLPTPI